MKRIHPASCTCPECEADLACLFAAARAGLTAPSCPKCDLLGRVFGDFARAFAGAAAMLGFEAPEDVAPAMVLAQLRQTLQRRTELEAKLTECAAALAQNVAANKAALERFRLVADLLDRGDTERARHEVSEVLDG